MKIVICLNTAWNLWNMRRELIKAMVAAGHEVIAVAPHDEYGSRLALLGCRFVALSMDNRGTHPGRDALLLWRIWRLLQQERPDAFLAYTVKPNVYGSLAAHALGIPVVNNIAGLGAVFIRGGPLEWLVRQLYRLALRRSAKVFFQNADDQSLFIAGGLVPPERCDLLPGSGVDLVRFAVVPLPHCQASSVRFVLIGRLLRDKGVVEFVEAARIIRRKWPAVQCCLLGFVDALNPAAISSAEVDAWVSSGDIHYLGVSDDVRQEIAQSDCVVLPSYREGTPRSLLEAAAMGRPIITTDATGCRDVVDDGRNGYLCKVANARDLAEKMERFLQISRTERIQMGLHGRALVEARYDEKIVLRKYLDAVDAVRRK